MTVAVPGPAGARIQDLAIPPDFFETGTIDAPHIAVPRRQRAAIGKQLEPGPWESQFHRPSAVYIAALIQSAFDVYGMAHARKIPVEKSPPLTSRMYMAANAIQDHGALRGWVEFRPMVVRRTGL